MADWRSAVKLDQMRHDRFEQARQTVQHLHHASQIQPHLIADAPQRNAVHVMQERNAGDELIAKQRFGQYSRGLRLMGFFAVRAIIPAQPVEDRFRTRGRDFQYRPVPDAFIVHRMAAVGASRIQADIDDPSGLLWIEAFSSISRMAFGTASTLGLFLRVRVGFDRTLGRWCRGAEETLILLLVAIVQQRFQSAVLFQELIDPALFLQAAVANGVRFHTNSGSEARKTGAAAWQRCSRASARRG